MGGEETCDGSQLTIGGVDTTKFTGEMTWVPNTIYQKALGYWLITGTDFKVGASTVACTTPVIGCPMVVDSGTSVIVVPPDQFLKVNKTLPIVNTDCSNVKTLPTITIHLAGKDFSL